jgi:hypothetical protein
MRMTHVLPLLAACCFAFAGCSRTETFNISVRNDTPDPVTLTLAKNGPPFERVWASPEDLAVESPEADEEHSYLLLPPGREADVPAVTGRFSGGTRGFLRVYRGDLDISDMNAIGPVSPNRLDLPLKPGANRFVVTQSGGRLVAGKDRPAAAAAPAN